MCMHALLLRRHAYWVVETVASTVEVLLTQRALRCSENSSGPHATLFIDDAWQLLFWSESAGCHLSHARLFF